MFFAHFRTCVIVAMEKGVSARNLVNCKIIPKTRKPLQCRKRKTTTRVFQHERFPQTPNLSRNIFDCFYNIGLVSAWVFDCALIGFAKWVRKSRGRSNKYWWAPPPHPRGLGVRTEESGTGKTRSTCASLPEDAARSRNKAGAGQNQCPWEPI